MILQPGEAIICTTREGMEEFNRKLEAEGYLVCDGSRPLTINCLRENYCGVRWLPKHKFPSCVAYVGQDIVDELVSSGKITEPRFTYDEGVTYSVRFCNFAPIEIDDLL